jgi:flagellar capping protein FliD
VLSVSGVLLVSLIISYIALSSRISKLEEHNINADNNLKIIHERLDKVDYKIDTKFSKIEDKMEAKFDRLYDKFDRIDKLVEKFDKLADK